MIEKNAVNQVLETTPPRYYAPANGRTYNLFLEEVGAVSAHDMAARMYAEGWADDERPTLLITTREHIDRGRLRSARPNDDFSFRLEWMKSVGREGALVIDAEPVWADGRVLSTIRADAVVAMVQRFVSKVKLHAVQVIGHRELLDAVRVALDGAEHAQITWKFIEFNPTRAMRGAPAARVEAGTGAWLWMNPKDIRANIKDHGEHPELQKALAAYKGMA